MQRRFGTAGLRGVTNAEVTPELVFRVSAELTRALSGERRGNFAVGHDTRYGAELLAHVAAAAVAACGHAATLYGCVPTGVLALNIVKNRHAGGILITGSHMPPERIGLIPLLPDGACAPFEVTDPVEQRLGRFDWGALAAPVERIGPIHESFHHFEAYVADVVEQVDAPRLKRRGYRVFVDPANGAASLVAKELYQWLGCEVELIHYDPAPVPARPSEPRAATLGEAIKGVQITRSDLGFGFDVDADRVVFIDEQGAPISEDTVGGLFARAELRPGELCVVPVNSSGLIETVCRQIGARLEYCRIGQPLTIQALKQLGGVYAYEESGKYYFARRQMWCDGLLSAAKFLDLMARSDKSASALAAELPRFHQVKQAVRLPAGRKEEILNRVRERWERELTERRARDVTIDGLKRLYDDQAWLLVRPSGTEELIRVYADAPSEERARALVEAGVQLVRGCL
jgi:phosphomannomutase/phosphoglucomutase